MQDTCCKDFCPLDSFIFSLHTLQECPYGGEHWLNSEPTALTSCGQRKSYHRKTMSVINSYFCEGKGKKKGKSRFVSCSLILKHRMNKENHTIHSRFNEDSTSTSGTYVCMYIYLSIYLSQNHIEP